MKQQSASSFQLLELDTTLLGFNVAKITVPQLSSNQLQIIFNELRAQDVRLVYWPADSTDIGSQQAAKQFNGFLGSEQLTYLFDLKTVITPPQMAPEIEFYQAKTPTAKLEQLALYAGTYSHFNTDPKFSKEFLVKLYRVWIANSVNGSVAEAVLISRSNNKITGMITLGTKHMRGDIGLLGVDPAFRGQNLGTKLVYAAQAYFSKHDFLQLQVVTQKANVIACRLYEKCGFTQEKCESFYHFWL